MSKAEELVQNLGAIPAGVLDDDGESVLQGYESAGNGGSVPTMSVPASLRRSLGNGETRGIPAHPLIPQSKLSELWLRYGPDKDPNFVVSLYKLFPKLHMGDGGWVQDFYEPISEGTIRGLFPDGGRFLVVVKGSHPKSGAPGHEKAHVTVDVATEPRGRDPRGGPSMPRRRNYLDFGAEDGDGYRRERPRPPAPPPQVHVQPDNSAATMAFQTLRDVLNSSTSGKDAMIMQLRELLEKPGRSGLDPSTVQSLIDANEAQKAAIASRHESQLTEERERATRELERATARLERQLEDERSARSHAEEDARRREDLNRDRYEREITQLRTQLEDERKENHRIIDRMTENHRDELRRLEASHNQRLEQIQAEAKLRVERIESETRGQLERLTTAQSEELKRVRHDLESRVQLAEKSKEETIRLYEKAKEEALAIERERAKMLVDQVSNNAKTQIETTTRQAESSVEHVRQLSEMNRTAGEAKDETMRKMLEFQLEQERDARRKAEAEARRYQEKAEEAHDPITALSKYKDVVDTVGSFFGGGAEETAIVAADEDKSLLGRVERLLDSRFGQRAGEIVGMVVAGAAQKMQQPGPQPMPQPMPMAPTPRQVPQPQPQYAPQPQYVPQPIPQQPRPPASGGVEQQAAEVLFGGPAGVPSGGPQRPPQAPQAPRPGPVHPAMQPAPQPINAPQAVDNPLLRVKMWVQAIEDHIENNTPPERIAENMVNELPGEMIGAFVQFPVEMIVQEVLGQGIETRGVINSERGVTFLRQVQAVLQQRVQPA